ncbi:hypothetical protein CEXT_412481 [Caerostris extrusa]|uniref:Uncharacterized protein n=1 Tax=Caerostris extrusa TaxID=172846 RepID=A0AAV4T199_CAEEX|nr:hypothetical protein CEXT_412481 [Caerostris extrusa]
MGEGGTIDIWLLGGPNKWSLHRWLANGKSLYQGSQGDDKFYRSILSRWGNDTTSLIPGGKDRNLPRDVGDTSRFLPARNCEISDSSNCFPFPLRTALICGRGQHSGIIMHLATGEEFGQYVMV